MNRPDRAHRQTFVLLLLTLVLSSCIPVQLPAAATAVETPAQAADTTASAAEMSDFPVTLENCGLTTTYAAPPARAVTMNQGATEIMLALGLQERMAGTAYLDDTILPEYQAAYAAIPVLAEEYPSQEVLLAAEPDFVYGAYASAFAEEAAGSRTDLAALGIGSYLSSIACDDNSLRPAQTTFETVYSELRDIGRIFGVTARAEALIAELQGRLDEVRSRLDGAEPVSIFWYDSGIDEPLAGACCGAPNLIIAAVGASNIFTDAAGNWATVNWETVVERSPQVIVVIDAAWDPAQQKIDLLQTNPAYASITAVQDGRLVVLPFSATTLGVRNVTAVVDLAKALYPERFD